jgi:kumamolisin
MAGREHAPVVGSERKPLPGAKKIGPPPAEKRIEVTLVVRTRAGGKLPALGELSDAPRLTPEQYEAKHGADPADIAKIEEFAREHGLDVVESSIPRRSVILGGTIEAMSKAFATELELYEHPGGIYRGRTGPVHVPTDIEPIVDAVLGLDDREQAVPHFRMHQAATPNLAAHAVRFSYTPDKIAQLYGFPTDVDGTGETVAIIELGGGFRTSDLTTYFKRLGIKKPGITAVGVDGHGNSPTGDPNGPDGEVMLDIEVVGAAAPGASILVYFAPNTDRGFLDAITSALHDQRRPSVISISWGGAEATWTAQAQRTFDLAFQAAAALGVTVCAAAGDDGSADGVNDGQAHVDYPASSPYVLACGGTRLEASNGNIDKEVVWSTHGATGGGVSDVYSVPPWQSAARVPPSTNPGARRGRGVPDVAGDADPGTGYQVRVDGVDAVIGGTSAVAPLWAALIARMNQRLGQPVGYLNPALYTLASGAGAFRDIKTGSNGAYRARKGWDACTGLGTPNGANLLTALSN